jgi:uncharacterized protein YodC (DUF2158 family)
MTLVHVPADISAGAVVQLKSGGPSMTVRWAGEDQYGQIVVACDWFTQDGPPWKKETGSFPPTSLKVLEP